MRKLGHFTLILFVFVLIPFFALAQAITSADTILVFYRKKVPTTFSRYSFKEFKTGDKISYKSLTKSGKGKIRHISKNRLIVENDTVNLESLNHISKISAAKYIKSAAAGTILLADVAVVILIFKDDVEPRPLFAMLSTMVSLASDAILIIKSFSCCNTSNGVLIAAPDGGDSLKSVLEKPLMEHKAERRRERLDRDSIKFEKYCLPDLEYRTNIRFDPLLLGLAGFGVGFEHRLSLHSSIMAFPNFTVNAQKYLLYLKLNPTSYYSDLWYPYNSIGIHIEYRYYIFNRNLYVAPFLTYRYIYHEKSLVDFDYHNEYLKSAKGSVVGIGILMGRQKFNRNHERFLLNVYWGISLKWRYSSEIVYGYTGYDYDDVMWYYHEPIHNRINRFYPAFHFGLQIGTRFKASKSIEKRPQFNH